MVCMNENFPSPLVFIQYISLWRMEGTSVAENTVFYGNIFFQRVGDRDLMNPNCFQLGLSHSATASTNCRLALKRDRKTGRERGRESLFCAALPLPTVFVPLYFLFFSRVHATLLPALAVGRSVRLSIRLSVRLSFFFFLLFYAFLSDFKSFQDNSHLVFQSFGF